MTDARTLPGWNILPRSNFDINDFAPHHDRLKPAICVVSHEAPALERLRAGSPDTLYIYRDSLPGHGTDDNIHRDAPPEAYVRYLHAKASPGAALYLGNEPDDLYGAALWALKALDACDAVGRRGVVLNLSHGRPEPNDWRENRPLNQLLHRLSSTQHVLGLHEYMGPSKVGEGYWIGRCAAVNTVCAADDIAPPQIAITEIGLLAFKDGDPTQLDPGRGWQTADMSDVEMMAQMAEAWNIYALLPNVKGTALFCAGDWGEGVRADKSTMVKQRMEAYRPPAINTPRPPRRPDNALVATPTLVKSTRDPAGAHVRALPMVTADIVGSVQAGQALHVFTATWTPGGAYYWVWVERPDGSLAGWVADVAVFENDLANRRKTGPLPPEPAPEPEPTPIPIGATPEELRLLIDTHTQIAALNVKIAGIYAGIQARGAAGVKAVAVGV